MIQDAAVEEVLSSLTAETSALAAKVPDAELPTTAGNYKLVVTKDGDTITYSWVTLS